jgi:hypothetical protein
MATHRKQLIGFDRRVFQKVIGSSKACSLFHSAFAAASKSSRAASRGLVTVSVDGSRGSMIELNSETYSNYVLFILLADSQSHFLIL